MFCNSPKEITRCLNTLTTTPTLTTMRNNLIQEETKTHIITFTGLFHCKHCDWVWRPRKDRPLMCPHPKCKRYLEYEETRWICLDCNNITEDMHPPRMCMVCGNDKFKEE